MSFKITNTGEKPLVIERADRGDIVGSHRHLVLVPATEKERENGKDGESHTFNGPMSLVVHVAKEADTPAVVEQTQQGSENQAVVRG